MAEIMRPLLQVSSLESCMVRPEAVCQVRIAFLTVGRGPPGLAQQRLTIPGRTNQRAITVRILIANCTGGSDFFSFKMAGNINGTQPRGVGGYVCWYQIPWVRRTRLVTDVVIGRVC